MGQGKGGGGGEAQGKAENGARSRRKPLRGRQDAQAGRQQRGGQRKRGDRRLTSSPAPPHARGSADKPAPPPVSRALGIPCVYRVAPPDDHKARQPSVEACQHQCTRVPSRATLCALAVTPTRFCQRNRRDLPRAEAHTCGAHFTSAKQIMNYSSLDRGTSTRLSGVYPFSVAVLLVLHAGL